MTAFPGSPRLLEGGIVVLGTSSGSVQRVIPLQYSPDTLTRRFQIRSVGVEAGNRIEALRLKDRPVETNARDGEIATTDRPEVANERTIHTALHPIVAALEGLVYPTSAAPQSNHTNGAAPEGTPWLPRTVEQCVSRPCYVEASR